MKTDIDNAAVTEQKPDLIAAIAMENFEIEDIFDLDLHSPFAIDLCSSCASTS